MSDEPPFLVNGVHQAVRNIAWVLRAVRDLERVPANYLKKLVNTDDIWEIRVDVGRKTLRLLGSFQGRELITLTNSFQKKSQKTPQGEIRLAKKLHTKKSAISRIEKHAEDIRLATLEKFAEDAETLSRIVVCRAKPATMRRQT